MSEYILKIILIPFYYTKMMELKSNFNFHSESLITAHDYITIIKAVMSIVKITVFMVLTLHIAFNLVSKGISIFNRLRERSRFSTR